MTRRIILTIVAALSFASVQLTAQEYEVPEIKISQDKVRVKGKSYYAHVATEKQTLYSISKAYNASLQDIYDANRNLDLENAGLKAGQLILIPVEPSAPANADPTTTETNAQTKPETEPVSPAVPATPATPPGGQKPSGTGSSAIDRWLFPGKNRQQAEQPAKDTVTAPSITAEHEVTATVDTAAPDSSAFELEIPSNIQVSIILPFTNSRLSDNSVDFYSGLLLAARDLGNNGVNLDIHTLDIRDTSMLNGSSFRESDIIFGPITVADMKTVTKHCPKGKLVISPLDPQAASLPGYLPIIQAPTPIHIQNADIVHWALEDMAPGDSLVLITSRGSTLSEGSKCIVETLKASGARYHTISYELLEGLSMQRSFEAHVSLRGVTRYLIAADDEPFVNDAVRNVNLMMFKKHDVVLYAPSRIRSFNMIETEYLHSVNTHISAAYFTDYANKSVGNFIMAYRALFNTEPNSFAFHGYDTLHYFVNICRTYGRQWPKVIEMYREKGLQTDFQFFDAGEGFTNAAVRRIVYTPDFRTVLL